MTVARPEVRRASPSKPRVTAAGLGIFLGLVLMLTLAAIGAPLTLVAAGSAAIVGLGVLTRPRAATLLFIGLLYANVPVVAADFHGVPNVIAVAGPLLLLGVPFMSYLVIRREEPVVTPTLVWMVAYLAAQIVSTLVSSDPQASAAVVAEFASESLILYVLITNAVRDWQTLQAAVVVLLVVGAALGGLSVLQESTGTYENQYGGFAQTREVDPLDPAGTVASERLAGPIGEKNRYAQIMLILVPLALFAFLGAKTGRGRLLAAAAALLILAGMLLTFSRGAGVAMGILVAVAIGLKYVRLRDAVLLAAAVLAAVLIFAPRYIERVGTLGDIGALVSGDADAPDGAILGRATSNLASLHAFLDHPLLGVGPGQFVAVYSAEYGNELGLRFRETSRRAHNMMLEVGADTGIVGVIALSGVFGATLVGLWRVRRGWLPHDRDRATWATAFFLAVLGYLLTSLFLHIAYARYLWLLMGLANSVIWILDRELAALRARDTPRSRIERAARGQTAVATP